MLPAAVLTGPRVTLKPLEISDTDNELLFDQLFAALTHEKSGDLFQYMTLGPFENAASLRDHYYRLYAQSDVLVYLVCLDSTAIGSFSFFHCSPNDKRVEIGVVWIGGEYHGRGLAVEVAYLMLQHAFENTTNPVQRVEWSAHHLNVASQAAATKIGFVYEGTLRKHRFYKNQVRHSFMYGIIDEEWVEKKERLKGLIRVE
ncbi:UNVERIFIED_CONTAM: hypothetical protein HDU68_012619 [Siphonaria sp. JEL0065]|nr:hypothetical protein HDU68_012619 [Siphonaria sp. JEL0065]